MVFCSVFKIIKRNDTKFLICGSQAPIFFNLDFSKVESKKVINLKLFILLKEIKKRKQEFWATLMVLKMTKNINSWSRISLLGCILLLLPVHLLEESPMTFATAGALSGLVTSTWTCQLAFAQLKIILNTQTWSYLMYLDQTNVPKVFFYWSWLEGGEGGGEGRGKIRPENCRFLKILKLLSPSWGSQCNYSTHSSGITTRILMNRTVRKFKLIFAGKIKWLAIWFWVRHWVRHRCIQQH